MNLVRWGVKTTVILALVGITVWLLAYVIVAMAMLLTLPFVIAGGKR